MGSDEDPLASNTTLLARVQLAGGVAEPSFGRCTLTTGRKLRRSHSCESVQSTYFDSVSTQTEWFENDDVETLRPPPSVLSGTAVPQRIASSNSISSNGVTRNTNTNTYNLAVLAREHGKGVYDLIWRQLTHIIQELHQDGSWDASITPSQIILDELWNILEIRGLNQSPHQNALYRPNSLYRALLMTRITFENFVLVSPDLTLSRELSRRPLELLDFVPLHKNSTITPYTFSAVHTASEMVHQSYQVPQEDQETPNRDTLRIVILCGVQRGNFMFFVLYY